jgi:tetratricopeptide (TPR) repeat protein
VLLAATYASMMNDYRTRAFGKELETHLDQGISLAKARIDARGDDLASALRFLGAAHGFKGLWASMRGSWWDAFQEGRRLQDALETSLQLEPGHGDALYGLGFFLYWRSAKASVFRWLLLWGDEREKGIKMLRRAEKNAPHCAGLASHALTRVYLNEKRWGDLHAQAARVQKRYPDALASYWWQAYAYVEQREWAEARGAFTRIVGLLRRKPFHGREGLAEAHYHIALANVRLGDVASARPVLEKIANDDALDESVWDGADYREAAQDLLDELD